MGEQLKRRNHSYLLDLGTLHALRQLGVYIRPLVGDKFNYGVKMSFKYCNITWDSSDGEFKAVQTGGFVDVRDVNQMLSETLHCQNALLLLCKCRVDNYVQQLAVENCMTR